MDGLSARGKMVQEIVKDFCSTDIKIESFEQNLQLEMNNKLKFKTSIFDVKSMDDKIVGDIYFKDEKGDNRVSNFIIIKK